MDPYPCGPYVQNTPVWGSFGVRVGPSIRGIVLGVFGVAPIFGGCVCVRTVNGNGFRDFFPYKRRLNDGGVETMSCNGCGKRVE